MNIKKIFVSAMLLSAVLSYYAFAQAEPEVQSEAVEEESVAVSAPAEAEPPLDPNSAAAQLAALDREVPPPVKSHASSYWGLRGLSQTLSAHSLGLSRFNVSVGGGYWQMTGKTSDRGDLNAAMLRGALGYGIREHIDIFGVLPINTYQSFGDNIKVGELMAGAQWALPYFRDTWFKWALHGGGVYGLTDPTERITLRDKDDKNIAGYDYIASRNDFELYGKIVGTIGMDDLWNIPVLLHGNVGFSYLVGGDRNFGDETLLLLSTGLQYDPIEFLAVGLELNSRTTIGKPTFGDPLWLTPSVMYRTPLFETGGHPSYVALQVGMDIDLTTNTKHQLDAKGQRFKRQLEPWRLFGDVTWHFDFDARNRAAAAQKRRADLEERARLEREGQLLAAQKADLAQKALEDSIRAAENMARRAELDSLRAVTIADSLANLIDATTQRARQDSIALAAAAKQREEQLVAEAAAKLQQTQDKLRAEAEEKRVADSIALAEVQKKLEEERAKRSEAEQFLLSTGMIVLDAVYFTQGRADISRNSLPYLRTIAQMLVKYPNLRIEIGGHSDNQGNPNTNMRLSQQRAEAVYLFMVQTEPALAQMLTAKGYGSSMPKEDNRTARGREANRRVELKVLNPEALKDYNP